MRRVIRVLVAIVLVTITLYSLICVALFLFQRSLIYSPAPRSNQSADQLLMLRTEGGAVLASTRPIPGPDALIYFGGNAEDVSLDMPGFAATFPYRAIYLMYYAGYGGSSGDPSEKKIVLASLALFDYVHAEHRNVAVIGRSLGTGVAVHLASLRPVTRLVLVTPFDSLADAAAEQFRYFPVRWLLRDKFESWRYAPKVTAPTRIIVAGQDEVIPRASTDRLRTRFKEGIVSYLVVEGVGHTTISDSPDYLFLLKQQLTLVAQ